MFIHNNYAMWGKSKVEYMYMPGPTPRCRVGFASSTLIVLYLQLCFVSPPNNPSRRTFQFRLFAYHMLSSSSYQLDDTRKIFVMNAGNPASFTYFLRGTPGAIESHLASFLHRSRSSLTMIHLICYIYSTF
jgi:hypothetical protein